MSTDCENILKKFLVLNPVKRATLEVCFIGCCEVLCIGLILQWARECLQQGTIIELCRFHWYTGYR